jgi:hypothetical protein
VCFQHEFWVLLRLQDFEDLHALVARLEEAHRCYDELRSLCARTPASARLATLLVLVNTHLNTVLKGLTTFRHLQIEVPAKSVLGVLAPDPRPAAAVD